MGKSLEIFHLFLLGEIVEDNEVVTTKVSWPHEKKKGFSCGIMSVGLLINS